MADSSDNDNLRLDIEQDPIITHAQPISGLGFRQMLDVAMQSGFQPLDFAQDLRAKLRRQFSKSSIAVAPYSIS